MSTNINKNRTAAIETHNIFRKSHESDAITLDEKLCEDAQKYADYLASIDKVIHDPNTNCGENIITMRGMFPNGRNVTNCWYKEINKYNFDKPGFDWTSGHFSQVVWKNSKLFGYGEAISKSKTVYVVARYYPPGNVKDEYYVNVIPPVIKPQIQSCALEECQDLEGLDVLEIHNTLRKKHGSCPLTFAKRLQRIAKIRAKKHLNSDLNNQDSKDCKYGENVSVVEGVEVTENIIIGSWYDENESYDFSKPGYSESTCHFTQLIWKNSKKIGFATVRNKDAICFVAIYYPKGNIDNEYENNVKPFGKETPKEEQTPEEKLKSTIKNQVLTQHNEYRNQHGCKPLLWSTTLETEANEWVEKLSHGDQVILKPFCQRGQNIDFQWEIDIENEAIVGKWYSTEKYYDYAINNINARSNPFTQIVWKSTQFLGFSYKTNESGMTIYVAFYWPPGNIKGLYEENVSQKTQEPVVQDVKPQNFENLMLKYHNKYRRKHKSPLVFISEELSKKAEEIANEILNFIGGYCRFGHYEDKGYSYNYLISKNSEIPNPKDICKLWYSTSIYYEHDIYDKNPDSAPFYEMVWNTTRNIGVGTAKNENMSIVVVIYDRDRKKTEKISSCVKPRIEVYKALSNAHKKHN